MKSISTVMLVFVSLVLSAQQNEWENEVATNPKIIHSFYVDSHFDTMTKYYEFMDWGVYETEFDIDIELYNLEGIKIRAKKWRLKR